jgi:hypothetical protein
MPAQIKIPKSLLLLMIVGILVAGLWPFDFKPQNNVRASPRSGLHINRYGQILSNQPWQVSEPEGQFSVELWFQPAATGYGYDSPVLSLSDAGGVNFAIGQSGGDLYAAVISPNEEGFGVLRKLWIDGACGTNRPLFVTVVSSREGVAVSLDGHLIRSFVPAVSSATLSGTILLGHTPTGDQPWSGDLIAMALYDRKLSVEEVIHHVDLWSAGQTAELNHDGALGLYDFRSASADSVRNLGRRGPDLAIPKQFYARDKGILGWPATWNRSSVVDAIVNTAGFVPLGFLLVMASDEVSRKSARRVLITAVSIAAVLSLSIELLQVYLPSRDSSLSDLLTNILGAGMGASFAVALRVRERRPFSTRAVSRD